MSVSLTRANSPIHRRRLRLEPLEDRHMLSLVFPGLYGMGLADADGDVFRIDYETAQGQEQAVPVWLGELENGGVAKGIAGSVDYGFYGVSDPAGIGNTTSVLSTATVDFANPGDTVAWVPYALIKTAAYGDVQVEDIEFVPTRLGDFVMYGAGVIDGGNCLFSIDFQNRQTILGQELPIVVATPTVELASSYVPTSLGWLADFVGFPSQQRGIVRVDPESEPSPLTLQPNGSVVVGTTHGDLLWMSDPAGCVPFVSIYGAHSDYEGLVPHPGSTGNHALGIRSSSDVVYDLNVYAGTLTEFGALQEDHLNGAESATAIYKAPTDLGTITSETYSSHTPFLGQRWYQFVAGADGILNIARQSDGEGLSLYAAGTGGTIERLASGSDGLVYGGVESGKTYYVHFEGLSEPGSWTMAVTSVTADLGTLEYAERSDYPPNGTLTYTLTASRNAAITAKIANAHGTLRLYRYDSSTGKTTSACLAQGTDRLDYLTATAGQEYLLSLTSLTAPPNLVVGNVFEINPAGTEITAWGLSAANGFTATLGATTTASVNFLDYSSSTVTNLIYRSNGGEDSASVTATTGNDSATFGYRQATVTASTGVSIQLLDTRNIDVYGNGGVDSATFNPSSKRDVLEYSATSALYWDGTTYNNEAHNFKNVTASATANSNDKAIFHDTAAVDTFVGKPGFARLFNGNGDDWRATGFLSVTADSAVGGADLAILHDSSGDDVFVAEPTFGRIDCDPTRHHVRAENFAILHAYSSSGSDQAWISGSTSDDTLEGTPTRCKVYSKAAGYFVLADKFADLHVLAHQGGTDTAQMEGSSRADTVECHPLNTTYSNNDYSYQARDFERVVANGTAGGGDVAWIYDSTTNDNYEARPGYCRMAGTTAAGATFDNRLNNFSYTRAYAQAGGTDTAYFYDSSGDDSFYTYPTWSRMWGDVTAGQSYNNKATGFEYVRAESTLGSDSARLVGHAGNNDNLVAHPDWARMWGSHDSGSYNNRVGGFRWVYGFGNSGDSDLARLYDSTAADTFAGWVNGGRMLNSTYRNTVEDFRYVRGFASNGATSGSDMAYLYGSLQDDQFTADTNWAQLVDGAMSYLIRGEDWDWLRVSPVPNGETQPPSANDTRSVGTVNYTLRYISGSVWTDV